MFSQHTTLTQMTCVRKNEKNKKNNVCMLFFVMFVNVVLCVDALKLGVFDSTIFFLFWCYFIDERKVI
jgi:hypothetical protein